MTLLGLRLRQNTVIMPAALVVTCSLAALLRVAQSFSGHDAVSGVQLLAAVRWRIWDWSFWIPATPIIWQLTRRAPIERQPSASAIARLAGVLLCTILAHRLYSLVGMWLFVPNASLAIFTDRGLLSIAPIALTDSLTFAAVLAAYSVMDANRSRYARIVRRREMARAERARAAILTRTMPNATPATEPPAPAPLERIVVRTGRRQHVVELARVRWIEADGYCSRLHNADGTHLVRMTMRQLEASLDPGSFLRVHRSAIANIGFARELRQGEAGLHSLILSDGTAIPVSRAKYRDVRNRLVAP